MEEMRSNRIADARIQRARIIFSSEWDCLIETDPMESAERLKSFALCIGVVAALVAIIAVQLFFSPPSSLDPNSDLGKAYAVLTAISLLATLATVLLTTIMYCELNMVTVAKDVYWLLKFMSSIRLFDICLFAFMIGVILLVIAICMVSFGIYNNLVGVLVSIFSGAAGIVMLSFYLAIDSLVRRRVAETLKEKLSLETSS
jgi:hypothetical protein